MSGNLDSIKGEGNMVFGVEQCSVINYEGPFVINNAFILNVFNPGRRKLELLTGNLLVLKACQHVTEH